PRESKKIPQPTEQAADAKFEYPGIPTTCDGAEAVVHVETQVAQAAGAYPITSSTTMGGGFNAAVMNGQRNLWGDPLLFFEPESEHSAATVCEGFAVATHTPLFNVQDGFLTTHTVETVRLPESEFMKEYIGDPKEKLINLMDPANPIMSGVVQNQDSYMKGKIAQRWYYDRVEPALEEAFEEFYRKTGRKYDFLEPYRCEDAEYILIGMGCYMETAKATVDYLRDVQGIAAGCVNVFVFRPFPARQLVKVLKDFTAFAVFECMADPLSTTGNHLTREVKAAFCDALNGQGGHERIERIPRIYGCSAGLG